MDDPSHPESSSVRSPAVCSDCGAVLQVDAPCAVCSLAGALSLSLSRTSRDSEGLPGGFSELMPSAVAGERIGDYELLEVVSRGGMGVVYRARQVSLDRVVALKMILAERFGDPQWLRRFQTEALSVAKLRHPGIVAIHEVGEQDGRPFFSMDYIEGPTLAEVARRAEMSFVGAAVCVRQIADAVQHAHHHGILHRDLKPSNVLVDASGAPLVTDFGLAKNFRVRDDLTLAGQVVGSPNYMSPEQANGRDSDLGPWTDVYGLGAILYQLLLGRPPFQGDSLVGMLQQIREVEPVTPRALNPSLPRDLETICLKCLRKEPAKRYPSAAALADDLERFVAGRPIRARAEGALEGTWRWCRRRPALAGALVGCFLLAGVGFGGILWQWRRAQTQAERANQGELEARLYLYSAEMSLGFTALAEHNYGRVRSLLAHHAPEGIGAGGAESPSDPVVAAQDLRGWEWRYLARESRSEALVLLGWHSNAVAKVVASRDGMLLASGSYDGTVKVWDLARRQLMAILAHEGRVTGLGFSPDGRWLATSSQSGRDRLSLWSTVRWESPVVLAAAVAISDLAFSPSGRFLATASSSAVSVWDLESRTRAASLPHAYHLSQPWRRVGFGAGESEVIYSHAGGHLYFWDWQTSTPAMRRTVVTGNIHALRILPGLNLIVVSGQDKSCRVLELATGREIASISTSPHWIDDLAVSSDGVYLATGGRDQRVTIWETATWTPLRYLRGHNDPVWAVEFVPARDGLFATGSVDGSVRLWKAAPPPPGVSREWRNAWLCAEERDGGTLEWRIFPVQEQPFDRFQSPDASIATLWPVATCASGWIAAGIMDLRRGTPGSTVHLSNPWTAESSVAVQVEVEEGSVQCLGFSEDGTLLCGGSHPGSFVYVWRLGDGERLGRFAMAQEVPTAVALSPDHRWCAVGSREGRILVWSIVSGRVVGAIAPHDNEVLALAFSPDGTRLASTGLDGRTLLTRLGDGEWETTALPVRMQHPLSVAFSRDNRTLAVGDQDSSIHLFNLETRLPVGRIGAHRGMRQDSGTTAHGMVGAVLFLPDGNRLVSAAIPWAPLQLFQVKVWDATPLGADGAAITGP